MKFKHLQNNGLSYLSHFKIAFTWCLRLLVLSFCAFIHSIWPDAFTYTVTENIKTLAKEIKDSEKTKDSI